MNDEQDIISDWIAREIIPHEQALRRWLIRRWSHAIDVEDAIQEAYCRLANLKSVDHIDRPVAYFFRTAHAAAVDIMRREGILNLTAMSQLEWSNVIDNEPLADRSLEAGQELERVNGLLAKLPETYRKVIELRRIDGLSRKETAERLQVSENEVKNYLVRGLMKIMKVMAEQDAQIDSDGRVAERTKEGTIGKHRSR